MTSNTDPLAQSLNLIPYVEDDIKLPTITDNNSVEKLVDDFETARSNIESVLKQGSEAMMESLAVLKGSQHPRAIEAFSSLMGTVVEANKQFLEIQRTVREIKKEDVGTNKEDGPKTVNNNLFVGTTEEVLNLIKNNGNTK